MALSALYQGPLLLFRRAAGIVAGDEGFTTGQQIYQALSNYISTSAGSLISNPLMIKYLTSTGILTATGPLSAEGGVNINLTCPVCAVGGATFGTNLVVNNADSSTKDNVLSLHLQRIASAATPIPRVQLLSRPLEVVIPSAELAGATAFAGGPAMMGYTDKYQVPLADGGAYCHTHKGSWLDNPYCLTNVAMSGEVASRRIDTDVKADEIGTIRAFAYNSIPYGWIICNGASLSRITYAALWAKLGTTWGSKDAASFSIPDLVNRVARGSTTAGAYEEDAIQNITGSFGAVGAVAVSYGNGAFSNSGALAPMAQATGTANMQTITNFNAANVVRTASETRVKSARIVYAIRYTA